MTAQQDFPVPDAGLMRRDPRSGAVIADNATVVGDVRLAADVNVWFQCVLRGDEAPITIGARTNVQDGAIIHTDTGKPCVIGADCTIGHAAMVHGLEIGAGTLIGIHATILGGARIGAGCVIAAGAVVKENAEIPADSLVVGVPGRVIRPVGEKEREFMRHSIPTYLELANRYLPRADRKPAGTYRS
ncbi:MAG TPA: gamma carbonic anhydrase family protein [Planctomycetota bacterium]